MLTSCMVALNGKDHGNKRSKNAKNPSYAHINMIPKRPCKVNALQGPSVVSHALGGPICHHRYYIKQNDLLSRYAHASSSVRSA